MIRSLFLSIGIIGLISCQTQKIDTEKSSDNNTQTQNSSSLILKQGELKKIPNTNLKAKYIQMTEDSRCPEDVTCVWQGLAKVELELSSHVSRPQVIELSTMDFEGSNAKQTKIFDDYEITLERVSPWRNKDGGPSSVKNGIEISFKKAN